MKKNIEELKEQKKKAQEDFEKELIKVETELGQTKCELADAMYEKEEVSENDAKQFAESIGAFFEITSAKNNTGINDLFMNAANRFVDPNFKGKIGEAKESGDTNNVKLDDKEHKTQKKKSWC